MLFEVLTLADGAVPSGKPPLAAGAGVMIDTELHPSIEGTMQGGPLSPISDSELTETRQS